MDLGVRLVPIGKVYARGVGLSDVHQSIQRTTHVLDCEGRSARLLGLHTGRLGILSILATIERLPQASETESDNASEERGDYRQCYLQPNRHAAIIHREVLDRSQRGTPPGFVVAVASPALVF